MNILNNMKYYNDSLAYDFDMFMPSRKKETQDNIVKMPKAKVKKQSKTAVKQVSVSAFAVLTCLFVLSALCGNIFLRLRINEVNNEINNVQAEIDVLESEKTALEVEYERRITYANVELEATELGMQKLQKDQVKYIRVNEENTAVDKDGNVMTSSN